MELYHEFGMAFEAHQQNTLIELEEGMPKMSGLETIRDSIILRSWPTKF